jgi:hypothetical protein
MISHLKSTIAGSKLIIQPSNIESSPDGDGPPFFMRHHRLVETSDAESATGPHRLCDMAFSVIVFTSRQRPSGHTRIIGSTSAPEIQPIM